ncbi:MAG: aminotransferase class V-fold PLP-dependent enzyme [Cyclobacteriaceae bacterium]|nr:aminotransferase class V-fold PLP-dependent enzyme [Cyclobacteriaceae bacterium]MCB0500090.1 aminotransferase class V-fold PLP-dependent enzyme [Cyclobacteriaceae bacterium]MCB9239308.1 aminotransferase class V-fold PLP-dependent enzyme [Flammeovirgaceae bacterium]MCO5271378.1 aminotransferase class V-fold PLP-dependent enzyme [Cyclobacteriaceae bacterium]MCW5903816.1 aminotransferase class V-fold PLP-dependent enzyme [Cyclobacteriaceae bacterium]
MDKRSFLKQLTLMGLSVSPSVNAVEKLLRDVSHLPAGEVAKDEDFWAKIRGGYKLKPDYINLENGYYCFLPQETLEHFIDHVREVNYQGSYYMRTVQWDNKKAMAEKLAGLAGCGPEELIITRNTTESLDLVISGMHWKEGDEAVMAEQDYGAMLNQFKLVAKRYGVTNKTVSVPNHPKSDQEIVDLYASAITDKTKLLMVCHMINITGHILPIRKICDMAHSKGVLVMVDGAHAFAHINYSIADLDCDYYGTSLHKWLSVPLGAGFLYVKKGKVDKVWPLLAEGEREPNDISLLNHIGTHPVHTDLSIANAIDYYLKIGRDRKEERLRYLQRYWSDQVRGQGNIIINTPEDPALSCGIANVGIRGMKPHDLADTLMKKYKIYTVAIDGANVHGCRITPNIYTTPKELDVFVKALKEMGNA